MQILILCVYQQAKNITQYIRDFYIEPSSFSTRYQWSLHDAIYIAAREKETGKSLWRKKRKKKHVKKGGADVQQFYRPAEDEDRSLFSLSPSFGERECWWCGWVLCGWLLMFSTPRGYNKRTPLRHQDRTRKKSERQQLVESKKRKRWGNSMRIKPSAWKIPRIHRSFFAISHPTPTSYNRKCKVPKYQMRIHTVSLALKCICSIC